MYFLISVVYHVLVLLWQSTMTKAAYKGKHLIWGSQLYRVRVHDHHGGEHGSRQAWSWCSSLDFTHITCTRQRVRHWECHQRLNPQSQPPTPPPARPRLLSLPKQPHQQGLHIWAYGVHSHPNHHAEGTGSIVFLHWLDFNFILSYLMLCNLFLFRLLSTTD